ncbi:mitochondrial fission regulator 1-like [Branchiostoma floridae]|uniref:Mitochondrial fission regulator 1-like n=1 Tax=Branchiostoma floridae TaxID=7739 RepID=A0A9J7HSG2_BRAFL|nr:mitochondrial fission regulator 1-like [Branchiostoma floridae]
MDHSLSSQIVIHIINHLLPYVMVAHQHLCTLWVSWWPKSAQRKVKNVSHRSIVRVIGTYLSLKPQHHRLYFQVRSHTTVSSLKPQHHRLYFQVRSHTTVSSLKPQHHRLYFQVRSHTTVSSLKPQHHRLYFQTVQPDQRCSTPFSEDGVRRAPVSLADIAMLEQEEPLPGIYISCELGQSRREARRNSRSCVRRKETEHVLDTTPAATCNPSQKQPPVEDAALQRISALEAELNKLRAQIALMATVQPQTPSVQPGAGNPLGTPQAPPPAPPPPPPPPPPPASLATPVMNIKEIIRKNKSKRSASVSTPVSMPSINRCIIVKPKCFPQNKSKRSASVSTPVSMPSPGGVPNMMAVLKDMSNVKLRSVERSPGGTPVRQKPKEADAQDPAALIAQALRRKFAHRKPVGSPDQQDKENDWPSPDASCSPKHKFQQA